MHLQHTRVYLSRYDDSQAIETQYIFSSYSVLTVVLEITRVNPAQCRYVVISGPPTPSASKNLCRHDRDNLANCAMVLFFKIVYRLHLADQTS